MKRISMALAALCLVAFLAVPSITYAFVDADGDGICDTGGGDGIPDYDGDGPRWQWGK